MYRRHVVAVATAVLVTAALVAPLAQRGPAPPQKPGVLGGGVTLLPNGWKIAPAGRHIAAGDLPLNMVQSPDGRYLVITNNGYAKPTLTVVDLKTFFVVSRADVDHAWLGLAFHPDGQRLFSSGAAQNVVNEFAWTPGTLKPAGQFVLGRPERRPSFDRVENPGFIGGVAVSRDGKYLYAAHVLGRALSIIDLGLGRPRQTLDLPAEPYTVLLAQDNRTLFVSLWGGANVLMLDPVTLAAQGEIAVGEHPNAMALSADGARLFVACANTNSVWVVDIASKTAQEQISIALYPDAPNGSTPNAVAVSPDGTTLAVANADNNTIALVDISQPGASQVKGWMPTGWYPTGVLFDRDGARLYVLSGKGLTSSANPRGGIPGTRGEQYIGGLLTGSLTSVTVPNEAELKAYTRRVLQLTPYTDAQKLAPADAPTASPIPKKVGEASPIKYVFYFIRENRTYDQVLGDLEKGNGDPALAILGEEVTPNAHALAREFVLLDNFYVDAEVSYDGHAFSTGAIATDVVEKIWPTNYAGRGALYLSEGGGIMRNPYGNIAAPAQGYLWDFAKRAGVSVRSYGEFAYRDTATKTVKATVPGLEGLVSPTYPPYSLAISDFDRYDAWRGEFDEFERNGQLPRLNIIRLGNDHTNGTVPGALTPRAYVAQNDAALGRFVETISKSRYWKESAIFVVEDDAQNGSDHVDAHRSPAFVVSPFTRRQAVDSTMYSTSGVLRTMELILGIPPMTQYDGSARPLYNAFQATPVATGYTARAARVPLDERNGPDAPMAKESLGMNFAEADRAPDLLLNEVIWKSIRGAHAVMPPPVRAGFVRPVRKGDADDEDDG